jgi:hypothetical protein
MEFATEPLHVASCLILTLGSLGVKILWPVDFLVIIGIICIYYLGNS